jgi:hypothetical protein
MKKLTLLALLLFCSPGSHAQANPPVFRCKDQRHIIKVSLNVSGQSVEGPACAEITINALRYNADFGKTVSYTGGVNLPSIFPSSFSPGGAAAVTPKSLEEKFNADNRVLTDSANQLILIEGKNRTAGSNLDKYLAVLKNFIVQTDDTLNTGGAPGVLAAVRSSPITNAQMDTALASVNSWNTSDEFVSTIQRVQADLNSLPLLFPSNTATITGDPCSDANIVHLGWNDWLKCRDAQYKLAQSTASSLLAEANPWTSDGDKAVQFARKLGIVQFWKTTIAGLSVESFTKQAEVQCGVLFNRNEQDILKLIIVDRTQVFDGQTPQPQIKDGLLTVTCSSPFSISAGAAFSTIHNFQFAIIKSAPPAGGTTSVNKFGTTSDSRVNPYPIAMAHARLRDWNNNRYALHFSFGVGASVKGQDSGGSSPEFLTGLSLSFLRTIYLTGGLDVGKQSQLAGGFKVGDTVPTDITSPPVSSSYKPGFGFAITFTKP